jgi:putative endonuclease
MAPDSTYKNEFGRRGEELAFSFLLDKGFDILQKNYRYKKMGEIDLIARKDNLIIFVEVKSRKTDRYGGALYSINNRKKNTLKKIATQFLIENPLFYTKDLTCRFDLISIDNEKIDWIEDIAR